MLHFLTDEHISPAVADQAKRKYPGIKITALHFWRDGQFLGAQDSVLIPEAVRDGLTLVTYDPRTIRPLLKAWIEQGVDHSGIVFVDEKTIPPQDLGGLVEALGYLFKYEYRAEWKNRILFLRPPR